MPIYEYIAAEGETGCTSCKDGFESLQRLSDAPLTACPSCGGSVVKCISAPAVGGSQSNFDDRAKAGGFHKLKRLGKGEYEKQY